MRGSRCSAGSARASGTSFVELLISIAIVGLAMLVMLQQLTLSYRETGSNQLRVFAYQKSMAMLSELQAGVERGTIPDAESLEQYDDAGTPNVVLTTLRRDGVVVAPDHVMSGNSTRDGGWAWERELDIDPVPGQARMRFARVRMHHVDAHGGRELMASLGTVLASGARSMPPVQVHDVYLLAVAECPSLWKPLGGLREKFESARASLRTSAPNLEFRFHWISRLGYGRDPCYVPYLNTDAAPSASVAKAYWYPGALEAGNEHTSLFVPELFAGRLATDSGVRNAYAAVTNPYPCAIADQWNHCLRYPEAKALYDARLAAGNESDSEPPLQILLEDVSANPSKYQHALFVNLHGTALPFPPLRNYSDAAKDDVGRQGVRVVTHAGLLRPARDPNADGLHADTQDAEFRVYAYKTSPASGDAVLGEPITLEFPGCDLTQNVNRADTSLLATLDVRPLPGGIDVVSGNADSGVAYKAFDDAANTPHTSSSGTEPFRMWFDVQYTAGSTWLRLHNTPLVTPQVGSQGLASTSRLYGLEYVPSPVNAGGTFTTDLASSGSGPKNTARWRVRVPKNVFQTGFLPSPWVDGDTRVTVKTRIGDDHTTGASAPYACVPGVNQPGNLSITHAWWGRYATFVPYTERYQLLGDPRHCPYADLALGGSSWPHGYNWYFDALTSEAASWPCFEAARLRNGFGQGVVADVPRAMHVLRTALQRCTGIFSNAGGILGQQLLLGGEIALPAATGNGLPLAVSMPGEFYGLGSQAIAVDSVSAAASAAAAAPIGGGGVQTIRGQPVLVKGNGSGWWVKEWLGELCPTNLAATWLASGNIEAGTGVNRLHREIRNVATLDEPPPAQGQIDAGATIGPAGAPTFCQVGLGGTVLLPTPVIGVGHVVVSAGSTASLHAAGQAIVSATVCGLPNAFTSLCPFELTTTFAADAVPHRRFSDSYPAFSAALTEGLTAYYMGAANRPAAATVRLVGPAGAPGTFYLNLLGLTPANATEIEQLCTATLVLGLRGYHAAGLQSGVNHVIQVPRTEITNPQEDTRFTSPATIQMQWSTPMLRFDGQSFTSSYPNPYTADSEAYLRYVILYSRDGGESWCYGATNTVATAGVRPSSAPLLLPDSGSGIESYALATPIELFPAGDYLLRVECWHSSRVPHMSWHQVRVTISR